MTRKILLIMLVCLAFSSAAFAMSADDYYKKGMDLLYNDRQYQNALSEFNQAIKLDDKRAEFFYERGKSYMFLGEHDSALADFNKAIALSPDDVLYHFNRAWIYDEKGLLPEAERDYTMVINSADERGHAISYGRRGFVYYRQGQFDKALPDFDKKIEMAPELMDYVIRARIYSDMQMFDKALADMETAIAINGSDPLLYFERGCIYLSEGNMDKAIADFDKTIEIQPGYLNAYKRRLVAYFTLEDYERVMAESAYILEIEPDNSQTWLLRSGAAKELGDTKAELEALEMYVKYAHLENTDPEMRKASIESAQKRIAELKAM